MLLIILIIVLVLSFGGGFYNQGGAYPYRGPGWGLGGLIILVLLVLLLTGNLHLPR
jgi:hypothetical protein